VLDASGFAVGIRVATDPGGPGCPAPTLSDITLDGLRIENASFTGVLLRGVDRFAVRDGLYTGNRGVRDLSYLLPERDDRRQRR
jgi:hypothetical protein